MTAHEFIIEVRKSGIIHETQQIEKIYHEFWLEILSASSIQQHRLNSSSTEIYPSFGSILEESGETSLLAFYWHVRTIAAVL